MCIPLFFFNSIIWWMFPPAVKSIKPFRIRLQRGQVRRILRRRLGEERRPLLPLEHRQEELDWCGGLLPKGGRTPGLCHHQCHQAISGRGVERNRILVWRQWHWKGGRLEVDRLHSVGIHVLEFWGRLEQPKQCPGISELLAMGVKMGMGRRLVHQYQKFCVQQTNLYR